MTHEETTMSVPKHHLPVHAEGRKATWFELLFDLVFVVAVAQLSGAYAHHYNLAGAAQFVVAFLAMWWCWLVHTFHGTRFRPGPAAPAGGGFPAGRCRHTDRLWRFGPDRRAGRARRLERDERSDLWGRTADGLSRPCPA